MSFEALTAENSEIFQRVWERVMPDQSLSPVVIRETTTPGQPPQVDNIARLEGVIDGVHQWRGRLEILSRQNGGKTGLRTLCEGERRQSRRLDGLYFLMTGRRYLPRTGKPWGSEPSGDSLRRGFYLEMEWVAFYESLEETLAQPGLKELVGELREGALTQGRGIRGLV